MLTTADFLTATQWSGIFTLVFLALAGLAFLLKWGIRFRLVGVSGFMAVLTGGLFTLSLVPFVHPVIPGAVHFSVIYDSGATQAVITVPAEITESELEATLQQSAVDLFSLGRLSQGEDKLTIRARAVLHPKPGVSQPLYLGQIQRSLFVRDDDQMEVKIYRDRLAQLPHTT